MRSTRARILGASASLLALWLGCQRNSDLGIDMTGGAGGAGGAGGSSTPASASASASGTSASHAASSSGSTSASGTGGSEPNLPTSLTIVNGINDYEAIRVCFLPDPTPWPAASTGLGFGMSGRVDLSTLPVGEALTMWIIAGDLTATAGLTCAQMIALATPIVPDGGTGGATASSSSSSGGTGGASGASGAGGAGGAAGSDAGTQDAGSSDAGDLDGGSDAGATIDAGDDAGSDAGNDAGDAGTPGTGVLALELASIPASLLMSERSLLLVPTGCMGGAGHDDPNASLGCGNGYASRAPTATIVALGMSRISDATAISLQAVVASPAIPSIGLGVVPAVDQAKEVTLASSLQLGTIAPTPPFHALSLAGLGTLATVQLVTNNTGATLQTSSTTLGAILATSAVTAADVVNGSNLAFVMVGATPGAGAGPFWHPLTYALVSAL